MAACTRHNETLLLDVYGELSPRAQAHWQRHLDECAGCRREKERLIAVIRNAKEEFLVPVLGPVEAQHLSAQVQRRLRMCINDVRPKRAGWWLAPALAACMVLAVAGWFGLQEKAGPDVSAVNTRSASDTAPGNAGRVPDGAAFDSRRVADAGPADAGRASDTAVVNAGRDPEEQIINNDEELLENMGMLEEMDSLDQLARLLDEQGRETSRLERGADEEYVRSLV